MSDELDTSAAVASYLGARKPEQVLHTSLTLAADANPDAEAEFQRLSKAGGLPIDSVRDNAPAVKQRLAMPDTADLAAKFPSTTQYLSNIENARIAHDDVPNLAAIEKSFREAQAAGRAVRGKVGEPFSRPSDSPRVSSGKLGETFIRRGSMQGEERSLLGGLVEPVRRGLAQGDRGLTILLSELGVLNDPSTMLANQQRSVERFPMPTRLQEALEAIGGAQTMGTAASQIMRNPRAVLEVSLQSIGASAPALVGAIAGSVMGPAGTATGAGLGSFAVEYASTIQEVMSEKGVDGKDAMAVSSALSNPALMSVAREKAVKRGIPIAIFDALTAGVAGRVLAGAKGTVASASGRAAGELGIQAGGGAAGEAIAQAATGEYKPGDILLEALAEMPSALVEVPANFRHAQEKAQRAEQGAVAAEQLATLAEGSKLKQRDPGAFKQFVDQVAESGDAPTEFFIDAEQLANSLNQSAVTIEELRAVAPQVAAQLEAAMHLPGADVRVPVAEFAAVPSDITSTLIDHLREAPDAMSRAEAQAFIKEQGARIQKDVESALGDEARRAATKAATDAVRQHFEEQLNAVGKFRPEVNKAYASLMGSFYGTQAERAGMTADEFLQRYQLKVAQKEGTGSQKLEQQDPAATPVKPDPQKQRVVIDMRKRHKMLETLRTCLG